MALREQVPRRETTRAPRESADLNKPQSEENNTKKRRVNFAQRTSEGEKGKPASEPRETSKAKKAGVKKRLSGARLGKSGKALLTTKRRYKEDLEKRLEYRKQRTRLTRARVLL